MARTFQSTDDIIKLLRFAADELQRLGAPSAIQPVRRPSSFPDNETDTIVREWLHTLFISMKGLDGHTTSIWNDFKNEHPEITKFKFMASLRSILGGKLKYVQRKTDDGRSQRCFNVPWEVLGELFR